MAQEEKQQQQEKKDSDVEFLKKQLKECEKKAAEYLDGWKRARADLLNYKKEEKERFQGFLRHITEGLILKILPILDNFDLAEKRMPEDLKSDENIKGILQIKTQILDFLRSEGIKEMETEGRKFDPNFMEAVEEVEDKEKESGMVIEEIQKGYTIDGRTLRPAKVKVVK